MEKIKYLWWDFEDALEEKTWLKVLFVGILIIGVFFVGTKIFMGDKEKVEDDVEVVEEVGSYEIDKEEFIPIDEEVVFILENPDDYSEEEVNKAFNKSVTSLDHPFVEDKLFLGEDLEDGVYVYYEKVSEDYKEILGLARELDKIGVPIHIYTPHRDQTIANLSNYTKINDEGQVQYKGVVVREGEVDEKYDNTEEFKRYLGGVINENK